LAVFDRRHVSSNAKSIAFEFLSVSIGHEREHMGRIIFLVIYFVGIVAVVITGYPWSQITSVMLRPSSAGTALDGAFWIALLVPFALIAIAIYRGDVIGRPKLFVLPLLAFGFSATAFFYGWLARAMAGGEPSAYGFLPMHMAVALGLFSGFSPPILHIACCVLGAIPAASNPSDKADGLR
jgi:hypothetical protein